PAARRRWPACRASKRSTTTVSSRKSASPAIRRRSCNSWPRARPSITSRSRAPRSTTSSSASREAGRMHKIRVVASSEFVTLTRSKAFLIGLVLMPVFMTVAFLLQRGGRDQTDTRDRRFVVIDHTGALFPALKAAADERNAAASAPAGPRAIPRFLPLAVDASSAPAETLRADLSDRVRNEDIYAFVEIPPNALDPAARETMRYYSNHPAYRLLPDWISTTLNREIVNERFRSASIDRATVDRLTKPVRLEQLGLVSRDARGEVHAAEQVNEILTLLLPSSMMTLMFLAVMSTSPQLLNSTIEEKM